MIAVADELLQLVLEAVEVSYCPWLKLREGKQSGNYGSSHSQKSFTFHM